MRSEPRRQAEAAERRRHDALAGIHSGHENILSGETLRTAGRHASGDDEGFSGAKQVSEPENFRRLQHLSVHAQKALRPKNQGDLDRTRATEIRIIKI